jgi:anaerobic ribonucleoside-triphosphate reductase
MPNNGFSDAEFDHNKEFLTVRTSRDTIESFDRSEIVKLLIKEIRNPKEVAGIHD